MKFLDSWLFIILLILFGIFIAIDHTIISRKMNEIKQINYQERIEHNLEWSRMLCDKQELIINQLYDRRIISMETQKALQNRNRLWLRQQVQRKVKNGYK